MKHAAPIMIRQRSGSIINNASVAASRAGYSSSMIYSAAKAAVVQLSRCVAMQLGEHGVRVNCISPGAIVTGILLRPWGSRRRAPTTSPRRSRSGSRPAAHPAGGDAPTTSPAWPSSSRATSRPFVTGQDIVVDGGQITGGRGRPARKGLRQLKQAFGLPAEG